MIRFAVIVATLFVVMAPGWADQEIEPPNQPPPGTNPAPPPTDPKAVGPAIEPLGGDRYRIGGLELDRQAREVRAPGAIAIRNGTLEYLICAPGGKLYESLLRADVDPYHLHLSLLLIGLQPRNNLQFQGDPTQAEGDPVTIHVSWQDGEKRVTHRAEDLVWETTNKKTMSKTHWVFTGSGFSQGVFVATMQKSLVAVYNDPAAILNNPMRTGGDDTAYTAYTEILPKPGTEVEIVFRAADAAGEETAEAAATGSEGS